MKMIKKRTRASTIIPITGHRGPNRSITKKETPLVDTRNTIQSHIIFYAKIECMSPFSNSWNQMRATEISATIILMIIKII